MSDEKNLETMTSSELLRLLDDNDRARGKSPGLRKPSEYTEDVIVLFELERRGFFSAHDAVIAWEEDDRGRVDTVIVAHSRNLEGMRELENLSGATIDGDWLLLPPATPEGKFFDMAQGGFRDRQEMTRALAGFAKIIECDWARQLHTAAMRLSDPDYDPDKENG